eukprot:GHVN01073818.1.p1 GENE.GHVN01073818.1~~GHVN01073818.1.p1  ORF type:complete len:673 (+),score=62.41 GHVN01073818.1:134-2020(+)
MPPALHREWVCRVMKRRRWRKERRPAALVTQSSSPLHRFGTEPRGRHVLMGMSHIPSNNQVMSLDQTGPWAQTRTQPGSPSGDSAEFRNFLFRDVASSRNRIQPVQGCNPGRDSRSLRIQPRWSHYGPTSSSLENGAKRQRNLSLPTSEPQIRREFCLPSSASFGHSGHPVPREEWQYNFWKNPPASKAKEKPRRDESDERLVVQQVSLHSINKSCNDIIGTTALTDGGGKPLVSNVLDEQCVCPPNHWTSQEKTSVILSPVLVNVSQHRNDHQCDDHCSVWHTGSLSFVGSSSPPEAESEMAVPPQTPVSPNLPTNTHPIVEPTDVDHHLQQVAAVLELREGESTATPSSVVSTSNSTYEVCSRGSAISLWTEDAGSPQNNYCERQQTSVEETASSDGVSILTHAPQIQSRDECPSGGTHTVDAPRCRLGAHQLERLDKNEGYYWRLANQASTPVIKPFIIKQANVDLEEVKHILLLHHPPLPPSHGRSSAGCNTPSNVYKDSSDKRRGTNRISRIPSCHYPPKSPRKCWPLLRLSSLPTLPLQSKERKTIGRETETTNAGRYNVQDLSTLNGSKISPSSEVTIRLKNSTLLGGEGDSSFNGGDCNTMETNKRGLSCPTSPTHTVFS